MNVKGSAILSSINYIKDKFGDAGLDKIKENLTDDEREILSDIILQPIWYPIKLYVSLTHKIDSILGIGDLSTAKDLGKYEAEHDLKTIYRIFYVLGSPEFIIKQSAKLFTTYFEDGDLRIAESDKNNAIAELYDFPSLDQAVLHRISGFMEKTLELSGGKNPTAVVRLEFRDAKKIAVFICHWE